MICRDLKVPTVKEEIRKYIIPEQTKDPPKLPDN